VGYEKTLRQKYHIVVHRMWWSTGAITLLTFSLTSIPCYFGFNEQSEKYKYNRLYSETNVSSRREHLG